MLARGTTEESPSTTLKLVGVGGGSIVEESGAGGCTPPRCWIRAVSARMAAARWSTAQICSSSAVTAATTDARSAPAAFNDARATAIAGVTEASGAAGCKPISGVCGVVRAISSTLPVTGPTPPGDVTVTSVPRAPSLLGGGDIDAEENDDDEDDDDDDDDDAGDRLRPSRAVDR